MTLAQGVLTFGRAFKFNIQYRQGAWQFLHGDSPDEIGLLYSPGTFRQPIFVDRVPRIARGSQAGVVLHICGLSAGQVSQLDVSTAWSGSP